MPSFTGGVFELYLWSSGLILLTTLMVKYAIEKWQLGGETGRKILHLVAVLTCGYVVQQSEKSTGLAIIFFIFFLILLFIAHHKLLLPTARKSYGIALFPLAFAILLLTPIHKDAIIFGIVTLGISDALAGWAGQKLNAPKYIFLYEEKSWIGFCVFYVSTVCISIFFLGFTPSILVLALIPALSELFSYRGSDNLTVPLFAAFWYEILRDKDIVAEQWVVLFALMVMLILVGYKKWLSSSGMAAALFLGVIILFAGNVHFLIPIGFFFIAGSITSRLHKDQKDASGRNALQVFANGWVAVICLLIYAVTKNEIFVTGYLVSIAISFADTMSSDIGMYFKQKTYDILTFRPVNAGLSGGISFSGTLAGAIAAILFSALSFFIFNLSAYDCIIISAAGIVGMTIDSILGSLWQAKYMDGGIVTENKGSRGTLIKGLKWLDNDGVNFGSNLIVTTIFLGCSLFFLI